MEEVCESVGDGDNGGRCVEVDDGGRWDDTVDDEGKWDDTVDDEATVQGSAIHNKEDKRDIPGGVPLPDPSASCAKPTERGFERKTA